MAAAAGNSRSVHLQLRSFATDVLLPAGTDVLWAGEPGPIPDVRSAVAEALSAQIGCPPLADLCREALDIRRRPMGEESPRAVVVISDQTRPAPYQGEGGILWPLVEALLACGFPPERITILVATGTHRVLSAGEIWSLVDEEVRRAGVGVSCHDAADRESLIRVGRTSRGLDVLMNREYVSAGFRILTGVVEPHFMAGASGGRKSICPGLLNVESVQEFHGPRVLADERAADLILSGNPCHELSLEIARMATPDFILNATICRDGRVAGLFAGDMERAHLAAVDHVRDFAEVPLEHSYDVVVTHGGHVGINHYQAAKAACGAARAVRDGGYMVIVADNIEPDPVGSASYRHMLAHHRGLGEGEMAAQLVAEAVARACRLSEMEAGRRPAIACLADGPHGVPVGPGPEPLG